ncbi:hypothetical protein [Amycolatopsis sp. FDAARGOS 1241]|uniref:hypothetical protein n=1 Tax=Amycolatopsis sp. FDAARGOS 1241 TaxID=2778070 RepID=UPI001EF30EE8|nr:hypothetical protein [Amycolatopsis sp. FDAARGOS 1241]
MLDVVESAAPPRARRFGERPAQTRRRAGHPGGRRAAEHRATAEPPFRLTHPCLLVRNVQRAGLINAHRSRLPQVRDHFKQADVNRG